MPFIAVFSALIPIVTWNDLKSRPFIQKLAAAAAVAIKLITNA